MKTNKFFSKANVDVCNAKSMYNFINNHFVYDVASSWNERKTVANNVKVYKMKLEGDPYKALNILEEDDYCEVHYILHDWEKLHPGYNVYFNGKNGGYLVLYSKNGVIPYDLKGWGTYDEWKDLIKHYRKENIKDYMWQLKETTRIIQSFDKLCDDLREYVNILSLS